MLESRIESENITLVKSLIGSIDSLKGRLDKVFWALVALTSQNLILGQRGLVPHSPAAPSPVPQSQISNPYTPQDNGKETARPPVPYSTE